jgi:hypothetical protein
LGPIKVDLTNVKNDLPKIETEVEVRSVKTDVISMVQTEVTSVIQTEVRSVVEAELQEVKAALSSLAIMLGEVLGPSKN